MKFSLLNSSGLVAAGLFVSLLPTTASATAIATGTANFGGEVNVTGTSVTFFNTLGTVANVFDAGSASGSYTGLTGGTINAIGETVGACSGAGCIDEITFVGPTPGPIMFDLTTIFPGLGTAANCTGAASTVLGAQCTPTGSPFTLTLTPTGVSILFDIAGVAYTGTNPPSSPTVGIFTAQVTVPGTIAGVLLAVGNNTLGKQSYSATVTTTGTPEPGTILMILTGLGMVALGKRSRFGRV